MSGYPVVVEGTTLSAVIAGGGRVATRKALSLLEAGARVHVVAPLVTPMLEPRPIQEIACERIRAAAPPH